MKYEDPTMLYHTTFSHIYFTSGFAISKQMAKKIGLKEEYIPKSTHGCLVCGYWCWQNAKEKPGDVFGYLTRPLRILIHKINMNKIIFPLWLQWHKLVCIYWNWRLPHDLDKQLKEWKKIDHRKDKSLSGKSFRLWMYLRKI